MSLKISDITMRVIALAARHNLPAVYAFRFFVSSGGLMAYGIDVIDLYQRAAVYVRRILKGDKPSTAERK